MAFIRKDRLPEIPDRDVPVAPDFAIEIVSPTDSVQVTHRKALQYLEHGTQMVWVVYPSERLVDVYTPDAAHRVVVQTFYTTDTLSGGEVLAGFSVPVDEVFRL